MPINPESTFGYLGVRARVLLYCLAGAPDPRYECTASTSLNNTGERSNIILFNEYEESE